MNSNFVEEHLYTVSANRLLDELRHAIFEAFVCNHLIVITCESNDVRLFNIVLDQLCNFLTGLETIHHRHAAVHKD